MNRSTLQLTLSRYIWNSNHNFNESLSINKLICQKAKTCAVLHTVYYAKQKNFQIYNTWNEKISKSYGLWVLYIATVWYKNSTTLPKL